MTTAAMVFGMLPTALKIGEGAESRAPMAIAVIGGLITSTLLTLVVIPVVYTLVDDLENFFKKKKIPERNALPRMDTANTRNKS
jgi:HAE1 family hydrophobic/amphiphilic exporter-1